MSEERTEDHEPAGHGQIVMPFYPIRDVPFGLKNAQEKILAELACPTGGWYHARTTPSLGAVNAVARAIMRAVLSTGRSAVLQ